MTTQNIMTTIRLTLATLLAMAFMMLPLVTHATPANGTSPDISHYTGVIVDCTGLGLRPAMSPVIKVEDGRIIYGNKITDYDKITRRGAVGYSIGRNSLDRAGQHPLVVRALRLDSGISPVLSDEDADLFIQADRYARFFDSLSVVFVR